MYLLTKSITVVCLILLLVFCALWLLPRAGALILLVSLALVWVGMTARGEA